MNDVAQRSSPVESDVRASGAVWYIAGAGSLGLATGFLVGASETPVVAILLPLLFGLIGAAGGFSIARMELETQAARTRIRLLGLSVLTIGILSLAGSIWGIAVRTGNGIGSFLPSWRKGLPDDVPELPSASVADRVRLLMLRSKLRLLGAAPGEISHILQAAATDIAGRVSGDRDSERLVQLASLEERVVQALREPSETKGERAIRIVPEDQRQLMESSAAYGLLAKRIRNGESVRTRVIQRRVAADVAVLDDLENPVEMEDGADQEIMHRAEVRALLAQLRGELNAWMSWQDDKGLDGEIDRTIDRIVKVMGVSKEKETTNPAASARAVAKKK